MVKTNNEEENERSYDSKRFAAYSPVIISMSLMLFIYTVYWNVNNKASLFSTFKRHI